MALPQVWWHPTYKPVTKILLTVAVIAFSVWSFFFIRGLYREMMAQVKAMGLMLNAVALRESWGKRET